MTDGQLPPQMLRPTVPVVYCNGFALQYRPADISVVLKVDGENQAILKFSYTVGKSLAQNISKMMDDFERVTKHDVMTTDQVFKAITEEHERKSSDASMG